ncbi:MAG: DUF4349 domain-containing protein, partial [Phycisphaerae bacterium]
MRHAYFTVAILLFAGFLACLAACQQMSAREFAASVNPSGEVRSAPSVEVASHSTSATDIPNAGDTLTLSAVPATQPARIVIYSASLDVVVADVARSLEVMRATAESLGGYMQELDKLSITVRVPAARFTAAVAIAERLGEVTDRNIKAQDITEQMRDLKIRLDNAEQVRLRLKDLVAKSEKMKDTLEIEKELERVTETIELLKGKIQFLSQQAAYSTLKVTFNSPLPQQHMVAVIPFAWVRNLGDGLVAAAAEA